MRITIRYLKAMEGEKVEVTELKFDEGKLHHCKCGSIEFVLVMDGAGIVCAKCGEPKGSWDALFANK